MPVFVAYISIVFTSFSCFDLLCDQVTSTLDAGQGTLREALTCNATGLITVSPTIHNDTISLDSALVIISNQSIKGGQNSHIFIESVNDEPVFIVEAGDTLILDSLTLLGGENSMGNVIINRGILILRDVTINSNGHGGVEASVRNEGQGEILVQGNTDIITAPLKGILFETDFSSNTGYSVESLGLWNGGSNNITQPPLGWEGVICSGNSKVEVVPNEGINGANALKLTWDPNMAQPTISLGKHLTGNDTTGYDELYIRYHVKFPNNFKAGEEGGTIPYWKWGRLWQNTTIDTLTNNLIYGNWTENRIDSKYVVWNFGGNIPYTDCNAVWGANVGDNLHLGSAGGERIAVDYFVSGSVPENSPGYFESIWDLNTTDRIMELEDNQNQTWHTIEYHFKLATDTLAEDGIFEMWWDGVNQGDFARIFGQGGAPNPTGIPTAVDGSGFNFFVLFDNMAGWNSDWSNPLFEGHILVNDMVISTKRIGANYIAGNSY